MLAIVAPVAEVRDRTTVLLDSAVVGRQPSTEGGGDAKTAAGFTLPLVVLVNRTVGTMMAAQRFACALQNKHVLTAKVCSHSPLPATSDFTCPRELK